MYKLGVMQGRLSERPFPKIQAFPWKTWQDEFYMANELGLYSIEWIFEENKYENNPIWTKEGRKQIIDIKKETSVSVKSVCADYFLENPFFRVERTSRLKNIQILKELIKKCSEVSISLMLMPVLEGAEIRTQEEQDILVDALGQCLDTAKSNHLSIGLETELPAERYLQLIKAFDSPQIGAYYDAGNCAGCGFDMAEDLNTLKNHLMGIHIKDKNTEGLTCYLGDGVTNFKGGFKVLNDIGFNGLCVFQSFFEHEPMQTIKRNIEFITTVGRLRESQ